MYNPRSQSQPPAHEAVGKDFPALMGAVATDLYHGLTWHMEAADQMRKIGLRGFGRMHDYGSHHDFCKLGELKKLLADRLEIYPDIDPAEIPKALTLTLNGVQDLKPHLEAWRKSESEFCEILTEAVRMAATEDMCVYNMLACILDGVQEEVMRIGVLQKRLALGEYGGHDLGVVSMLLHKHFEMHPEKGLDFDI